MPRYNRGAISRIVDREGTYDIARSVCMLWIVGFWHMIDYGSSLIADNNITRGLTLGALATFYYISGKFSYKRLDDCKNALIFLFLRFCKIYPLYILSIFTLKLL